MKAIFVHRDCVLRDSHIDPAASPEAWRLMPATLEAMRLLATEDTLVFLFAAEDKHPTPQTAADKSSEGLETLVKQVEAAGGRVDGLISCPHGGEDLCRCWGEYPGACWATAARFALSLNECYVLGDTERDVVTACAAGARPLVVLCTRSIGEVLGNLPSHKDFPIATNLTTAVSYIGMEEEINRQLGHPRNPAQPLPADEVLYADPKALPTIKVTSALAQSLQVRLVKSRVQLRDMTRWLSFFVLGVVGLGLGIAYILTDLYRTKAFPEFMWYITLQFIPRLLRAALFTILGAGITVLAVRSFYRSATFGLWRKRRF